MDEQPLGALRAFAWTFQLVYDMRRALRPVLGPPDPAQRLDVGGDVALEQRAIRFDPGAQRKGAVRLIGPEDVYGISQAFHTQLLGLDGKRKIEYRSGVVAVLGHGFQAQLAASHRHHRVRSEEHTSELQSPDHLVCR